MQLFRRRDKYKILEDILIKERTAILNGNFGALSRLMTEKELLTNISESIGPCGNLERLKQLAARNQAMLLAASEGIRAVTNLLDQQNRSSADLQTYSESGERQIRDSCQNNMARRV